MAIFNIKKYPEFTKDDWWDLIVDNMITEKDVDRIIENEKIRTELLKLRDSTKVISPGEVLGKIIDLTENLEV